MQSFTMKLIERSTALSLWFLRVSSWLPNIGRTRILDATRRDLPHVMLNTSFFDASNPKNSDRTATNWLYIKWDSQGFTYKHLLTFPSFLSLSWLASIFVDRFARPLFFSQLSALWREISILWVQEPRIMSTSANRDAGYISEVSLGRYLVPYDVYWPCFI